MCFQFSGKIDGVFFDNQGIQSIRIIPAQEYTLIINEEKYLILLDVNAPGIATGKILKYKNYIGMKVVEFGEIKPNFENLIGSRVIISLSEDSLTKVKIIADKDPSEDIVETSNSKDSNETANTASITSIIIQGR